MKNADLVETLWTLIALAGLACSVVAFYLASLDLGDLRHDPNLAVNDPPKFERLNVHARAMRRRAFLLVLVQTMFLLAGFAAMVRPPAASEDTNDAGRVFIVAMLVLASALLSLTQGLDLFVRRKLQRPKAKGATT